MSGWATGGRTGIIFQFQACYEDIHHQVYRLSRLFEEMRFESFVQVDKSPEKNVCSHNFSFLRGQKRNGGTAKRRTRLEQTPYILFPNTDAAG